MHQQYIGEANEHQILCMRPLIVNDGTISQNCIRDCKVILSIVSCYWNIFFLPEPRFFHHFVGTPFITVEFSLHIKNRCCTSDVIWFCLRPLVPHFCVYRSCAPSLSKWEGAFTTITTT